MTQPCCGDASCVYACPVNCIHPTPDEPDFGTAEMLHIDPAACVDCGACVSACPVDAIVADRALAADQRRYAAINADFYRTPRERPVLAPVVPAPVVRSGRPPLRVAVVGSGPAAMYAADELLTQPGARVTVYERLSRPYGLVRTGVAPDHTRTRGVMGLFDTIAGQPGFELRLGVEVGVDVTLADLRREHHAVILAGGAAADRRLGLEGEELPGCVSATDFVAWYNGHPDHRDRVVDLATPRVVVVGTGNVALDTARILLTDPDRLAGTSIAPTALDTLRTSDVREVVLLARRSPAQSSFTVPELAGLVDHADLDVGLAAPLDDTLDDGAREQERRGTLPHAVAQKLRILRTLAVAPQAGRRVILRYRSAPTRIVGPDRVRGLEVAGTDLGTGVDGRVTARPNDRHEVIATGLVLTSIGYRGRPVDGLPFDEARGTVPNDAGRVQPGIYVAGWIKRGPTGFIGTNKTCAQETVRSLVDDHNAGLLPDPVGSSSAAGSTAR